MMPDINDEEFLSKINMSHRNLFDLDYDQDKLNKLCEEVNEKVREYDNRLIKRGIEICLEYLREKDKYFEAWYFSDIECEIKKLLKRDNF